MEEMDPLGAGSRRPGPGHRLGRASTSISHPRCGGSEEYCSHYVDYRSKTGIEGDTTFEKLFLVDTEGSECLAVCGTGHINSSLEER